MSTLQRAGTVKAFLSLRSSGKKLPLKFTSVLLILCNGCAFQPESFIECSWSLYFFNQMYRFRSLRIFPAAQDVLLERGKAPMHIETFTLLNLTCQEVHQLRELNQQIML